MMDYINPRAPHKGSKAAQDGANVLI